MSLSWEVCSSFQAGRTGTSLLCVSVDEALRYNDQVDPKIFFHMAMTGDTVGVHRSLKAKCDVEKVMASNRYNALHACASGGFEDTVAALLRVRCTQEFLDSMMLTCSTVWCFGRVQSVARKWHNCE